MQLNVIERDNYVLDIKTTPTLAGTPEASFDDGVTWHEGTPSDSYWAWLVAGPKFNAAASGLDAADTVATITHKTKPLVRIKDAPVLGVRSGPAIILNRD
jgi:hypothetical protein